MKFSFDLRTPEISLPVIVTLDTCLGFHLGDEGGEAHGLLACLEAGREVPHRDPDHDQDDPEQKTLESRIHSGPPTCCAGSFVSLKTTTAFVPLVTRSRSSSASPGTHRTWSLGIDDQRQPRALVAGQLAVDEHVLQLLAPAEPGGPDEVPGLPVPHAHRVAERGAIDIDLDCGTSGLRRLPLGEGGHDRGGLRHLELTGDPHGVSVVRRADAMPGRP